MKSMKKEKGRGREEEEKSKIGGGWRKRMRNFLSLPINLYFVDPVIRIPCIEF